MGRSNVAFTEPFFDKTDFVRHQKGGIYMVVGLPDVYRLEETDEPAYAYLAEDGSRWVRRQTEFEDGRFVIIPEFAHTDHQFQTAIRNLRELYESQQ